MKVNEDLIFDKSSWSDTSLLLFDAFSKHIPDSYPTSTIIDSMIKLSFSVSCGHIYIPVVKSIQELDDLVAKAESTIKGKAKRTDKWAHWLLALRDGFERELSPYKLTEDQIKDSFFAFAEFSRGIQFYLGTHREPMRQLQGLRILSDYDYRNIQDVALKYLVTTQLIYKVLREYAKRQKEVRG